MKIKRFLGQYLIYERFNNFKLTNVMQLSILCFIWHATFLDLGVCGLYSLFLQHGG